MNNNKSAKKKGSGAKLLIGGLLAGTAVGAAGVFIMNSDKRDLQKKAGKVADAMENLADSAKNMFQ